MNPPMVHAVAVASAVECGAALDPRARRLVAAACGDGTVALVDVDLPAAAARGGRRREGEVQARRRGRRRRRERR